MWPYTILLVLSEDKDAEAWIRFAERMATDSREPRILLRGLVTVPQGESLSGGATAMQAWRDRLTALAVNNDAVDDHVRAYVDHQPLLHAFEEVRGQGNALLIVAWNGPSVQTGGLYTDEILRSAPSDLLLISGQLPDDDVPVLLSLRGGLNLSLSAQAAKALCGGDCGITLLHAMSKGETLSDLEVVQQGEPKIRRLVTVSENIATEIAHEAQKHGAVVLGAAFRRPDTGDESVITRVFHRVDKPVVLARAFHQESFDFHRPYTSARPDDPARRVDRWFAENTFHNREFSDLMGLLDLKHKRGSMISVALPALNEEATVGRVIGTLQQALMNDVPLIDELVLIDSNSTDRTVEIAESYGIPVYRHSEILPETGTRVGKGEALWKSLHVLNGDIVAWADTDVVNFHPRFIYGLVGPLLKYPDLQFVKGFYQRPIQSDGMMQPSGGGRVTELMARPMFNLFYPELAGLIQPLAGEYAGRRAALEQLPFFTGYGVETGLLIDLLNLCGLDCIAQVDLEVRIHHNQPLESLSKMSFAILQVFMARLEEKVNVDLVEMANRSLRLVVQEPERIALDAQAIGDEERPPIITIPAYSETHQPVEE